MTVTTITETDIRNLTTAQSFERGEDYYRTGAVYGLIQRGEMLSAEVQGSSYEPYAVTIKIADGGEINADCACPYDWGGCCKHIIAVLLTYLREADQVDKRPSAAELLTDLAHQELLDLLTELLAQQPHLINWVEQQLALKTAQPEAASLAATREPSPPIDPAPFRRRAHDIMGSLRGMRASEAYWYTGDIARQISELFEQAYPLVEKGDGRNALLAMEAVTQVYFDRWLEFDDSDGELGALFSDIGGYFAEALLSAELTAQERKQWAEKLTDWQGEIDDYGIDDAFEVAIAAATQGWDYSPLQAVLQGNVTNKRAWEDEVPWFADDLALIRLKALENQSRTTEYLLLAEAEGQTALYLTMLVKLNRDQEALDYAAIHLETAEDALALAQILREYNRPQDALNTAERGLGLHGQTYHLAAWLRDFAAESAQPELALRAAQAAFAASTSLENYQAVEKIAGTDWPTVKPNLLKTLADSKNTSSMLDIYLHEDMVDEAIQTVDKYSYFSFDQLKRVTDAAIKSHPDWAICQAKKQAEPIMDRGQSKYYHHAADWLSKARQAYLSANREDEWRTYIESLIQQHARKYALRPRLEALR